MEPAWRLSPPSPWAGKPTAAGGPGCSLEPPVDGTHYLFEVKGDDRVASPEVQAKKDAAEKWARFVTDNGDHGTWRYILVPESVLSTGKTISASP